MYAKLHFWLVKNNPFLVEYSIYWLGTGSLVANLVENSCKMKPTLHLSHAAMLPQAVVEHLHFLAKQAVVTGLFLSNIPGNSQQCVVVLLQGEVASDLWRKQKWVTKAFLQHGILIVILNHAEMDEHLTHATPFLHQHLMHKKILFCTDEAATLLPPFGNCAKRFKKAVLLFDHKAATLLDLLENALDKESYISAFHAFIALYEHYVYYLEWWLLGICKPEENLHQRLHRLSVYLPEIEKAFVRSSANTFYLIHALYEVQQAELNDPSNLSVELLDAFQKQKNLLASLVGQIISKHQKTIQKKHRTPGILSPSQPHTTPPWVDRIAQNQQVEAIYQYHHRLLPMANQKTTSIYYCLVVGEGISNQQLRLWYDAIRQSSQGLVEVVPVAHSRLWIQKNLFQCQPFFQHAMQSQFCLYQRHLHMPEPHWHVPFEADFPDLDFYRKGCLELYESLVLLHKQDKPSPPSGFGLLYSSFVLKCCRVIVYSRWSYFGHHLPLPLLLRMAEAAAPELAQLGYLMAKLSFDWIGFLNYHQDPSQQPRLLDDANLEVLMQIAREWVVNSEQ